MYWLLDFTKANPGTEKSVLERWHDRYGESASLVECVALSHQEAEIALTLSSFDLEHKVAVIPVDESVDAQESSIAAWFMDRVTNLSTDHEITVSTFQSSVSAVVAALKGMGRSVKSIGFPATTLEDRPDEGWPQGFMPAEEAMPLIVKAIAESPTKVRLTTLRPLLVQQDARFAKIADTVTARPRFVSHLMATALRRGLVATEPYGADGSNPYLSLTDAGRSLAAGQAPPLASGHSLPALTQSAEQSRSSQFITILREARMGPFQEVRTLVYEQIDMLIGDEGVETTASALIRDAVRAVRTSEEAGRFDRNSKPFPWSNVRQFLMRLLSRRPVLTFQGTVVAATWSASNSQVDGAIDDWRLALDGELVLVLLEAGQTIDMNDIADLAGALYNSRREDDVDRVIDVIRHLVNHNLAAEGASHDGSLQLPG